MAIADKVALLEALCVEIEGDLERVTASQKETQAGAVHAEARAEGTKDMRSTEVSYLARGLAKRVLETREAVAKLRSLRLRTFGEDDAIELSAVVVAEDDEGAETVYFVVPAGGGRKVTGTTGTILAVTPHSPLGGALVGKRVGDDATIRTPGGNRTVSIESIS